METLAQIDPDFQLDPTAQLFKALAEPARLRILNLLVHGGELCNCQVEAVTGYRNPKISRHFQFLKYAGLIQYRREGTWIFYSLRSPEDDRQRAVQALLSRQTVVKVLAGDPQTGAKRRQRRESPWD